MSDIARVPGMFPGDRFNPLLLLHSFPSLPLSFSLSLSEQRAAKCLQSVSWDSLAPSKCVGAAAAWPVSGRRFGPLKLSLHLQEA
jgi:hypothetical protein